MRKDLLIVSAILLILGFAISGSLGTILLSLGILVLLYIIFSKDKIIETGKITHHPEKSKRNPIEYYEREKKPLKDSYQKNSGAKSSKTIDQSDEKAARQRKSKERIERELKAWGSEKQGCPKCGSTKNPPNARFCADCGAKL